MRVILLNPPRYYWPFLSEDDNYMLPQALPCLAAVLRDHNIDVKPIDCLPIKLGWKSLKKLIERKRPDVVGVCVSETMWSHEAIKACKMVKEIDPEIITVTGGAHFSNFAEESLKNHPIDFIVIGEGEYTLLELVKKLEKPNQNFKKINGIAYKKEGKIITTKPRPLIENLDELPIPAYDLMPMDKYGKTRYLYSPGGATIHHSRGCVFNCDFCLWWRQMSQRKIVNREVVCYPKWRTKSVERTIEEIELLHHKYKKRYLEFVDGTWNVNQKWNKSFADSLIERNLDLCWFAFMRADFILRDERAGIFKKIVDSGLSRVIIGVERAFDDELNMLGKRGYSVDTKKCFHLLRKKYPQVLRQATFMINLRNETEWSILEQLKYAKEIRADYPIFFSLTPVPGTSIWKKARKNGWIEVENFRQYDWITPVMSSEYLSRDEMSYWIFFLQNYFLGIRWLMNLNYLFSPGKYKRMWYKWRGNLSLKIMLDRYKKFFRQFIQKGCTKFIIERLVKPKWYDR